MQDQYSIFNGAWSGAAGSAPSASRLASLAAAASAESVAEAAQQLCSRGDPKLLPQHLSVLACALWKPQGKPDPKLMAALPQANAQMCGYVFNRNDIVWTCRTCASDPTCCQCEACFRESDHTGHEVYFHRAGGNGGCCDCGDAEAWNSNGACPRHKDTTELNDPLSVVPPELQQGLQIVAKAAIEFMVNHLVQTVRGYHDWDSNVHVREHMQTGTRLAFQLHNDDVHTYDDVTTALRDMELSGAAALTRAVDKEGQALLAETESTEILRQMWDRCQQLTTSLLCSVVPVAAVYAREQHCRAICVWLNTIGKLNDGIRRYVTRLLISSDFPITAPSDDAFPAAVPRLKPDDGELARPLAYAPMNPTTILLLAHPFMIKQTRDIVNELLLTFILDNEFKIAFSELMAILYPALHLLYCRGIGCSADTIFHTTVQVYTAPSIIDHLSTDGVNARMLRQPGTPVALTKALLGSLYKAAEEAGFGQGDSDAHALQHHILVFRRTFQVCHDLGCILEPHNHAVRVSAGVRDQGALDEWTRILTLLQRCDPHRRKLGQHVEYESDNWLHGANLMIGLVNVAAAFLTAALAPEHQAVSPVDVDESLRIAAVRSLLENATSALLAWARAKGKNPTISPAPWDLQRGFWGLTGDRVSSELGEGVSIHIPLHRYVAQILYRAATGGVDLELIQALKDQVTDKAQFAAILLEQPLRCLSLAAQVHAGMWRRNGGSVASLIANYVRVPLAFGLYDMDVTALQCGCALAGPDQLLAQLLQEFEVMGYVAGQAPYGVLPCLADALQVLIRVVTELPPPPLGIGAHAEQPGPFEQLVCREVVHRLCIEAQSTSNLLRLKQHMPRVVSENFLHRCIQQVSDSREGQHGESVRELKAEFYDWFDPEFWHLSMQELQVAMERVLDQRKQKKSGAGKGQPRPVITVVPVAHPSFQRVRSLLYRPGFLRSLQTILRVLLSGDDRAADRSWQGGAHRQALGRIVHLVTLQLLCLDEVRSLDTPEEEFEGVVSYFTNMTKASDGEPSLLAQLASLHTAGELVDDFYTSGLAWCLKELAHRDRSCKEELLAVGIEFADGKRSAADDMEKRKKRAQKKALQALNKQAANFQMHFDEGEEEEVEESEATASPADLGLEAGADTCILCHERSASPIGYIAYVQRSQLLERTIERSRSVDASTYRVCAFRGAKVYRSANPESAEVSYLPKGTLVTVIKRVRHWAKVRVSMRIEFKVETDDVVGWCYVYDPSSGQPILTAVKPLQWRRFGGVRPYVTTCSHMAHVNCWETYRQSPRRASHIVCPLCKSISNVLVPHTPPQLVNSTFEQIEDDSRLVGLWNTPESELEDYIQRSLSAPRPQGHVLEANHDTFARLCVQQLVDLRDMAAAAPAECTTHKSLHTMWAAVAYKVQCAELNSRTLCLEEGSGNEIATVAEPWTQDGASSGQANASLVEQLFQSCRVDTLAASAELGLRVSLRRLILGNFKEPLCTEPFEICKLQEMKEQQLKQALVYLPSEVISGPNYPNGRAQEAVRQRALQMGIPNELIFSLLTTPLIASDLATIAVAAAAHARTEKAALELVSLCCIARFVQTMFEPCVIGVVAPPPADASTADMSLDIGMPVEALEGLQDNLYASAQLPFHRGVLRGGELQRAVFSQWVPFLRFAVLLRRVITGERSFCAPLPRTDVQALLAALEMPNPQAWLELPVMPRLLDAWAEHFRNFFGAHAASSEELDALLSHRLVVQESRPATSENGAAEENAVAMGLSTAESSVRQAALEDEEDSEEGGPEIAMEAGDLLAEDIIDFVEEEEDDEEAADAEEALVDGEDWLPMVEGEEEEEEEEQEQEDEEDEDEDDEDEDEDEDHIVLELPEGVDASTVGLTEAFPGLLQALQNHDLATLLQLAQQQRSTGWSLFGIDPAYDTIDESQEDSVKIAHTIYPFIGSISGAHTVFGFGGDRLSRPFPDFSHLGLGMVDRAGLIELPKSFTDLYQQAKYPNGEHLPPVEDPAMCLLCGAVLHAGNKNAANEPGECTLHTRTCNGETGIFLLVQRAATLLISGSASCLYSSVYVDEYGEPDVNLRRGKPLTLSTSRYRKLVSIYRQHLISREVTAQRLSSDSVIRPNWY